MQQEPQTRQEIKNKASQKHQESTKEIKRIKLRQSLKSLNGVLGLIWQPMLT